jgi:uncharacterized protein (TIGR02611 family)
VRVLRIIGGFALLLLGLIMIVTPGPGWLAIAGGIGLLATEFVWARRLLDRFERVAAKWKLKIKRSL